METDSPHYEAPIQLKPNYRLFARLQLRQWMEVLRMISTHFRTRVTIRLFAQGALFLIGGIFLLVSSPDLLAQGARIATPDYLEQTVHEAVSKDPSVLAFYGKSEGNVYYYRLDTLQNVLAKSPLRRAARTLIVREYFARRPAVEQDLWQPYLRDLSKAVDREFELLRQRRFPEGDEPLICPSAVPIVGQMFDRLAKRQGAQSAKYGWSPTDELKQRTSEITPRRRSFPTSDTHTRLFYLSVFEHYVLEKYGKLSDGSRWHEIVNNTAIISGQFYFLIVKPDGTSVPTGIISVDKNEIRLPGA
jgi:hypothetical protein